MLICFVFWCYFVIYAWLTSVFFGLQTTAIPDFTTHAVGNVNIQKPIGITETSYMILGASFTRPRLQHKNFAVLALCAGIHRWSANIRHMSPMIQKSFIPRSRHYHGYAIRILFDLLHNWENTHGTFDGNNYCGRYMGLPGIHTISNQTFLSAVSGNCVTGEGRVCLELPLLRGGFAYAQFTVTFQEDWTLL